MTATTKVNSTQVTNRTRGLNVKTGVKAGPLRTR